MSRLAECANVMVKISGLGQPGRAWTVEANGWIVHECIAMFGPGRIMFGSNFPVDSLCATFDRIFGGLKALTAGFPRAEQAAMFHDNAERIYRTVRAAGCAGRVA